MKHVVNIDVTRPDNIIESFIVITDAKGNLEFKFTPSIAGIHYVRASYGVSSGTVSFRVNDNPHPLIPVKSVISRKSPILEYLAYIIYTIGIGAVIFFYFKSIGILP